MLPSCRLGLSRAAWPSRTVKTSPYIMMYIIFGCNVLSEEIHRKQEIKATHWLGNIQYLNSIENLLESSKKQRIPQEIKTTTVDGKMISRWHQDLSSIASPVLFQIKPRKSCISLTYFSFYYISGIKALTFYPALDVFCDISFLMYLSIDRLSYPVHVRESANTPI